MGALKAHKGLITNLAFSSDTTMLLTIGHDGEMIVWNLKHEKVEWPK